MFTSHSLPLSVRVNVCVSLVSCDSQDAPDVRVTELLATYNALQEELAAEAERLGVNVPWFVPYIAATGDTGKVDLGGRLLDAQGISIFETRCSLSGLIIQDGSTGEGSALPLLFVSIAAMLSAQARCLRARSTPRFHCLDAPFQDRCVALHEFICELLQLGNCHD